MFSDAIRRRAQSIRMQIESGIIDINAIKVFTLMVEGVDRTVSEEDAQIIQMMQRLDRRTKLRLKKP